MDWVLKQKGHLVADSVNAEEILETCMELTYSQGKKDYSAMERRMNYEDFLEFVIRIVNSIYWIHGQPKSPDDNASAAGVDGITNEAKDMTISESKESGINSLQQESSFSLASSEIGAVDMCTRLTAWLDSSSL